MSVWPNGLNKPRVETDHKRKVLVQFPWCIFKARLSYASCFKANHNSNKIPIDGANCFNHLLSKMLTTVNLKNIKECFCDVTAEGSKIGPILFKLVSIVTPICLMHLSISRNEYRDIKRGLESLHWLANREWLASTILSRILVNLQPPFS